MIKLARAKLRLRSIALKSIVVCLLFAVNTWVTENRLLKYFITIIIGLVLVWYIANFIATYIIYEQSKGENR